DRVLLAACAGTDGHVAPETLDARPCHRAVLERPSQLHVRRSPQVGEGPAIERRTRQPGTALLLRRRGLRVPWTDFLADVAPVGVMADAFTLRDRDRTLQLDRQVRQAARRIEDV